MFDIHTVYELELALTVSCTCVVLMIYVCISSHSILTWLGMATATRPLPVVLGMYTLLWCSVGRLYAHIYVPVHTYGVSYLIDHIRICNGYTLYMHSPLGVKV